MKWLLVYAVFLSPDTLSEPATITDFRTPEDCAAALTEMNASGAIGVRGFVDTKKPGGKVFSFTAGPLPPAVRIHLGFYCMKDPKAPEKETYKDILRNLGIETP